ncbi:hypothetical protein Hamer_G004318 [Homarus americanus]|uniref:Uncharacterized protein n=1 Tax=Homarus americanus TaxID=6706 RepID=A0A8J5MQ69_HOMAM|nr:hypothetical protein Hamer_G004318 [Homarus americanus]
MPDEPDDINAVRERGAAQGPGMVAAVVASAPPLTGAERLRQKRDMFERGMSEPNLKGEPSKLSLERGFSWPSNGAGRRNAWLNSLRASSVASFDSGVSLSRCFFSRINGLRHSSLSFQQ